VYREKIVLVLTLHYYGYYWCATLLLSAWTYAVVLMLLCRYVNLELNPEKFTGYSGASAWKVWRSIYQENCFEGFSGGQSVCREKRVFFRLMSGLQSSITTQIAADYHFEDDQ
jgi:Endoplasmic Reticulum Oxidoreductin 1 (ERO1)